LFYIFIFSIYGFENALIFFKEIAFEMNIEPKFCKKTY